MGFRLCCLSKLRWEAVLARLSGQVGVRQERASAVCMAVCYHLRYSSILCPMPVREIQEFGGPEESQANAMASDEDREMGGHNPPVRFQGSYPRHAESAIIQLAMCCSQEQLAKPASKAAARQVWTTADTGNKARLDATTATSSASASASATRKATEAKATDAKRSWADEPVDPRYIGQDIDLATLAEDQIPELRRRAAVAKEEHERLMQEKRERLAAQEQATLEAEIALEELRLQRHVREMRQSGYKAHSLGLPETLAEAQRRRGS